MSEPDPYRLPASVVPSRYDLTLEPDLDAATFAGFESVAIQVIEPVEEIRLNALDLRIEEGWLGTADGRRLDLVATVDPEREQAVLSLAAQAEPGDWTLHLRFTGELNDKLAGFYRSTFTDRDGTEHTIATTQFESTHARRAFPVLGRAGFQGRLRHHARGGRGPRGDLERRRGSSRSDSTTAGARVRFADTMQMSTYLVAFVVGPLEVTAPVDVDGTPLRVVHPPGKGHLTAFALEVGAFALAFFADYYGIAYPGDKLDLIAIPDFAFGAMENLGCVTFRETLLLVDRDRATQAELQRVADVVAHEIAHMWFGDLVTMGWWNGIWLNEAFATFMEMLTTDAFRPEWERWTDFGLARSAAFDTDSLSTHPAHRVRGASPEDAEGMFDVLTYEKGAAVVRMLEQYLGRGRFRAGIRRYLDTHAVRQHRDHRPVGRHRGRPPASRCAGSWTAGSSKAGHPLVTVSLTDDGRDPRPGRRSGSATP